jgi:hypothetical protein
LLKVKDLAETYQYCGYIKSLFETVTRFAEQIRREDDMDFEAQKGLVGTLETITFV